MNDMAGLVQNAINDPDGRRGRDEGFRFLFDGDLHQMAVQGDFLRSRGFAVGSVNVYPAVRTEEEFKSALLAIWQAKVEGWWQHQQKYSEYGICTPDEFTAALDRECAKEQ